MRRRRTRIAGAMTIDVITNIVLIIVSAALVVYLVVALLDPERF
ncbi:ATPase [Mycobacteroides chelonae CCUG 47445]|nr:ATPase [Mycobacteroides chelonae CCUG 47445]